MNNSLKTIMPAALVAASAFVAMPAQAQVSGVATADPLVIIASAKARVDGYRAIATQYQANLTQMQTKAQEIDALQKQFDTNSDGNISEQEAAAAQQANNPAIAQIQAKRQEMATLQRPIVLAQYYVIENILQQYDVALQSVVTSKKINFILAPESTVFAKDAANVSKDITAALDTRIPAVATTPPANWQPTIRQTLQVHQQIGQLLQASAIRQAQQQAAAQPPAQPQGR